MLLKSTVLVGLLLLFSQFPAGLWADPIIGPAVEQNGLRFESWLVSPKIAIPSKTIDYDHCTATMLFSVRVTNLTPKPVRLEFFTAHLHIHKPGGEEIGAGYGVAAGVRPAQKPKIPLLAPGQSLVLPYASHFYWYNNSLCLDWPVFFRGRSMSYAGLAADRYYFTIECHSSMLDGIFSSRNTLSPQSTGPQVVPVLDNSWSGDVRVTSMVFELTQPTPTRSSPPLPKRQGAENGK